MSSDANGGRFAALVSEELERARREHGALKSAHEAYAVILEEVEELWLEAKKRRGNRSDLTMREELVQIAAMCQRAAEDLGLM